MKLTNTAMDEEEQNMKKIFTKNLCIYMVSALLVVVLGIFSMQTLTNQWANTKNSNDKLSLVKEKLAGNQQEIEHLKESMGEDNLSDRKSVV